MRVAGWCRHNQELEQDALATEQEKAKLQQEADSLAEQLEAVLHDKFATNTTGFDADTPIDKTMKFLQSIIMVSRTSCLYDGDMMTGCSPSACRPHVISNIIAPLAALVAATKPRGCMYCLLNTQSSLMLSSALGLSRH